MWRYSLGVFSDGGGGGGCGRRRINRGVVLSDSWAILAMVVMARVLLSLGGISLMVNERVYPFSLQRYVVCGVGVCGCEM